MIIVGQKVKTRRVDGGRSKVITCKACGRPAHHDEHRVVHTATLFFLPVANVVERTVWCCTGCGTRVAEGDDRWLTGEQEGTAVGQVMGAVGSLAEEAGPALRRLRRQVGAAVEGVFVDEPSPAPKRPRPPAGETSGPTEPEEPPRAQTAAPPKRRL